MKNRLFALVLALVMALSLFGCGQKPENTPPAAPAEP